MAEFKVIETQEDFDKAIQKRLEQKDREVSERFSGWLSPDDVAAMKADFEKALADKDLTIQDYTARASKAEHTLLRQQVAAAKGIPIELADRLSGETKETLEKDAENFASYLTPKTAPPMRSTEPQVTDAKAAAWAKMLAGI